MFLVDSHCHLNLLDLTSYQGELSHALEFAKKQGVGHFLCVSVTLRDFSSMMDIVDAYPNVSASVGLHPNETDDPKEPTVDDLVHKARHNKVVAIGETGLDYYRSEGELQWQRERFRQHIMAAKKIKKPLIIHSRQAREDTLNILKEENAMEVGGVMHCFTESWDMAKAAMDMNFYISFSGIVSFQNAKDLQMVAKQVPLNRMLIETDSPYLAPVPYRGKPNEPAYVRKVAECIAELRGIKVETVAEKTTENFFMCFKEAKRNV